MSTYDGPGDYGHGLKETVKKREDLQSLVDQIRAWCEDPLVPNDVFRTMVHNRLDRDITEFLKEMSKW